MEKLTVYGELCVEEYGTEWNTEVELEDELCCGVLFATCYKHTSKQY